MPAPIPDSSRSLRRSALVVATMASFLTPFLGSAVNVALPRIGGELGMDAVGLSWVASAFLLASAVALVPLGRLADLVGRRRVFLVGMGVFTLASAGCGLAGNAAVLVGLRVVQGAGAAMIFGTGLAILTSVYPPSERGRVIGWNSAAVYLGLSVGPFAGGVLTQHWGWASIFWVSVPLGGATMVVAWRGLRCEWTGAAGARFDFAGAVLYGAALIALMLGLARLPEPLGAGLVAGGLVAGGVFWWWEQRTPSPVFNVALLRGNAVFALSNLAALINYSATFAVTFLLNLYLQTVRGLDPRQAGLVLLTQSVTMAVVSPFSGRLSDRTEPRVVASAGMGLTVVGLAWLALLGERTPYWAVVAALVVLGGGFGLFASPNTNAVMSSVGKADLGVASATLGTMRLTGQMVSMGVAMLVLAVFVGRVPLAAASPAVFMRAMRGAFLVFGVLCVLGVFASLARGNVRAANCGGNRAGEGGS